MFRLISLLVVVAILAVLWLTVVGSTSGTGARCVERGGTTTTLPPELTKGLGAGAGAAGRGDG